MRQRLLVDAQEYGSVRAYYVESLAKAKEALQGLIAFYKLVGYKITAVETNAVTMEGTCKRALYIVGSDVEIETVEW